MPDIAMCFAENCEKKEECYRFKAEPSDYQSYTDFSDDIDEEDRCGWFWEIEEKLKD
mgnify:FL=1